MRSNKLNKILDPSTPNVLLYSKFCPYCIKMISFYQTNNLLHLITGLCIDNRTRVNGFIQVTTDDGFTFILPPNVDSVPTLIEKKDNRINNIVGYDNIREVYAKSINIQHDIITHGQGEPLSANSIIPTDTTNGNYVGQNISGSLGINSNSGTSYRSYQDDSIIISHDNPKDDKITATIDSLMKQRDDEIADL